MRLLSLVHLTVLDADPLGLIDAAVAGGFDAIGLRIVPAFGSGEIVDVVGDAGLQRRIKQRLSETGLKILDVEAIWLRPEGAVMVSDRSLRGVRPWVAPLPERQAATPKPGVKVAPSEPVAASE